MNVSFEVLSLTGVAGQKLWAKIDVDNQSNRSHTLALLLKERFSLSSGSNFVDKEVTKTVLLSCTDFLPSQQY